MLPTSDHISEHSVPRVELLPFEIFHHRNNGKANYNGDKRATSH